MALLMPDLSRNRRAPVLMVGQKAGRGYRAEATRNAGQVSDSLSIVTPPYVCGYKEKVITEETKALVLPTLGGLVGLSVCQAATGARWSHSHGAVTSGQ